MKIHPDLLLTLNLLSRTNAFKCSSPVQEAESAEYGAYTFEANNLSVRFRVAKTTPTKVGQFVTFWKRLGKGPIQPFDIADRIDFFVVSTRKGEKFGQFVFPKMAFLDQDIISKNGRGGKRAIRLYPPWENVTSRQARKTQEWQVRYFLDIPNDGSVDLVRLRMLYQL